MPPVNVRIIDNYNEVAAFVNRYHSIPNLENRGMYSPLTKALLGSHRTIGDTAYYIESSRELQTADRYFYLEYVSNTLARGLFIQERIGNDVADSLVPLAQDESVLGFLQKDYNGDGREDVAVMTSAFRLFVILG